MEAKAPEEPRVAGAVAVTGVARHVRTLHRLTGAAALDWCRVDQPEVVVERRAVLGEGRDGVLHRGGCVAESFVVRGPLREIRKQAAQVPVDVADETGFGGVAEQRLDHRQRDEFSVAELRRDPDLRPLRCPLWVFDEQVVDGDVESGREGVQVRVHALRPSGSGFV